MQKKKHRIKQMYILALKLSKIWRGNAHNYASAQIVSYHHNN